MIKIHDKTFVPFISAERIQETIKKMADRITEDYRHKNPLFIGVLNGAFVFLGDLAKHLRMEAGFTFTRLSSYSGTRSTGSVEMKMALEDPLEGRHLIVVEDIVDTGKSMKMFLQELEDAHPESIAIASLLSKPDALQEPIHIDYVGFEISSKFVVGYGLDYDGLGRNLPEIYQLND
jgi:hypoxanthine phosphoribosyltransferase